MKSERLDFPSWTIAEFLFFCLRLSYRTRLRLSWNAKFLKNYRERLLRNRIVTFHSVDIQSQTPCCSECEEQYKQHGFCAESSLITSGPFLLKPGLRQVSLTVSCGTSVLRADRTLLVVPRNVFCSKCRSVGRNTIHPLLWINFTGSQPFPLALGQESVSLTVSDSWLANLPWNREGREKFQVNCTRASLKAENAKTLQVAQVKQIGVSAEAECQEGLTQYFNFPRLVNMNDVFAVTADDSKNALCWFKIISTAPAPAKQQEGGGDLLEKLEEMAADQGPYWVHTSTTTLYQVGAVNSQRPQQPFADCKDSLNFSLQLGPFPASLYLPDFFARSFLKLRTIATSAKKLRTPKCISALLYGTPGCGKEFLARCLSLDLHLGLMVTDAYHLWSDAVGTTEAKLRNCFESAQKAAPSILVIKNTEVLGKDPNTGEVDARIVAALEDCLEKAASSPEPVIFIGTTNKFREFPSELLSAFLFHHRIENLKREDRLETLTALLQDSKDRLDENIIEELAERTPGFVLADLNSLVSEATMQRSEGGSFVSSLRATLDEMQADYGDSIGAPKIPKVSWDDVGGLEDAKKAILDTIQTAKLRLLSGGNDLKRSGVLLHGPPGCGKTLLAKAVASEAKLTFLSVKGPELLNMYVGQSEQNVREVFERARAASPCIIFFDELDALAPNRGRSGDSGGVMDRVVSQLLAELDGVQSNKDLYVIGATNRPDLVDSSLLRPGRFDKSVYVGLNRDRESQLKVLNAVLRKVPLAPGLTSILPDLVSAFPLDISGAEIYALVSQAATLALGREIGKIEKGDMVERDAAFLIEARDLQSALSQLFPNASL